MSRRQQGKKGSWGELLLFVMIILCIYFILALFDSALTGDSGREWGRYLRSSWGGAVIVILLFWLYICIAKIMKLHIPRVPRQVLGTIMLYISFAFMLGLLKETGWDSDWTLFLPGNFGQGLARFFVLNVGTFITLLFVIASFILTAYLYGSRILRVSFPAVRLRRIQKPERQRRPRETHEVFPSQKPESILFMKDLPAPKFREEDGVQISSSEKMLSAFGKTAESLPAPKLKPAPEDKPAPEPESPAKPKNAVEMIDDALALVDSVMPDAPKKRATSVLSLPQPKPRKNRRPLPDMSAVNIPAPDLNTDDVYDDPVLPPPLDIFGPRTIIDLTRDNQKAIDKQGKAIILTLKNFGIIASIAGISQGPSVIQYQLELAPGTKVNKISGLDEELAMALAVMSVRIEAPILGTHYAGVEVPITERKTIPLRYILESEEFSRSPARLPIPLGMQIDGKILVHGLEDISHILIAGGKSSGKSSFIHSCILSICSVRRPEELRLILIDPGHVEFAVYDDLPHLLASPVNDPEDALKALEWVYAEMEERTANFARAKVRNLSAYNKKLPKNSRLPEIVIVIDELADLLYSGGQDIESLIVRLAQKSGTSGIYTIIAAQRPSPDIFTTLIKSNIPARASFTLSSENDSKNMLNTPDASRLTGKGDMLYRNTDTPQALRLQTGYIDEDRIADFVEYMTSNLGSPELITF